MLREHAGRAVTVVLVVVILSLIAGSVLGQPVLLSFVTSESMSPTIQAGDGFVAIPSVLSDDVGEGDIIVFDAEEIEGGGLTTHRIVEETDEGYITKGDGNPFTDQDGVEPQVTDDQVVATAWQPGGRVVTIPSLGTAILGARGMAVEVQRTVAVTLGFEGESDSQQVGSLFIAAGLVLLVVTLVQSLLQQSSRDRARSRGQNAWFNPRYVALFLVIIVVLPANMAMLVPSTSHDVPVDGAAFDGVESGEPVDVGVSATNDGYVTMLVVFDPPPDTRLDDRHLTVDGRSAAPTTLYVPAPPPREQRTVTITERRYVMILPPSVLVGLHDVHPLLAIGATNGVLAFSILALVFGLFGLRSRRLRDTDRDVPLWTRLKRAVR